MGGRPETNARRRTAELRGDGHEEVEGRRRWGEGEGGGRVTEGEATAKTRGMARDVAVKAEILECQGGCSIEAPRWS